MKLLIITIHCIPNFGSLLQSYGLLQFFKMHGYDASIINYCPSYYTYGRHPFRKLLGTILNLSESYKQHRILKRFQKDYLHLDAPKIKRYTDLASYSEVRSIFIVGGDQLWNSHHPCGKDDAYKLSFVKNGYKLSYGTSIGRNNLSDAEIRELANKTDDFVSIGLREQSTVSMLSKFSKTIVYHAADPVLLLEKNDYLHLIKRERIIKEKYILVYLATKSDLLSKTVKELAKSYDLKVVHCLGRSKKIDYDYIFKSNSPQEMLNLIYNADYVVSASFHATVFSVLFEKQFCTLLPESNTNTRIVDWLNYCGLQKRILTNESDIVNAKSVIDYQPVMHKVDCLIDSSKKQLIEEIEKCMKR